MAKYFIFARHGREWDPQCRLLESNTTDTGDVLRAALEAGFKTWYVTVDFENNRYLEDRRGTARYKLVPYVEGRRYCRHPVA